MGKIIEIPFSNISYYQGNGGTARDAISQFSAGSWVEWGSPGDGSYYIGKIRVKLSNLSLPADLPKDTKVTLTIKSKQSYCGAGSLRGYITQTNFSNISEICKLTDGVFAQTANFKNAGRGTIKSKDIAGNDYEGKTIEFQGDTTKSLVSSSYLYIYILDQIYYSDSKPYGHTKTQFNENDFQISIDLPYTVVGNPGSASIVGEGASSAEKPIKKYRDDTLTLTWSAAKDGDNNEVKGYKIYYGISGQSYSQSLTVGNVTKYSFVISEKFGGPRKGTTFYLGVQALATNGGLHSEIVTLGYVKVVNKAPEIPSFSTSGVIRVNDGETSNIKIINLTCKDVDDDALEFRYVTNNVETISDEEKGDELSSNTIEMNKGNPYLHIRAKEKNSEVYGNWKTIQVRVNDEPDIEINFEVKKNHQADSKSLNEEGKPVKTYASILSNVAAKITYSGINTVVNTYKWFLGTESEGYKEITQFKTSQTSQLIVSEILTENDGKQMILKLEITDSVGDKFEHILETGFCNFYKILPENFQIKPIADMVPSKEELYPNEKYMHDDAEISFNISWPVDDIKRFFRICRGRKESTNFVYEKITEDEPVTGSSINKIIETKIDYNNEYVFKIQITDGLDPENIAECENGKIYEKLPKFDVTQGASEFTQTDWHPLVLSKKAPVDFTTRFADDLSDTGVNTYSIVAIYNGEKYPLAERVGAWREDNQGWTYTNPNDSTIKWSFQNIELFKKLKRNTDDSDIEVTYEITGYNFFGVPGPSAVIKGKIITQEAPSFSENAQFSAVAVINGAEGEKSLWFNAEEEVLFNIGEQPTDLNDTYIRFEEAGITESQQKSITNYIFRYRYPGETYWNEPQSWEGWKGNFVSNEEYLKEIKIKMPDLSKDSDKTEVILGFWVIDQNGKQSANPLTYTLYACRKEKATINIVEGKEQGEGILEVKLKISDFGGNGRGKENFTRTKEETYNIILHISKNGIDEFKEAQLILSDDDPKKITDLSDEKVYQFDLPDGLEKQSRLYVKVELELCYNSKTGKKITTIMPVFLLYLNSPTMSHRAHWVGINTTKNNEKDAFHVTSFDSRGIIRLEGADVNTTETIEVLIDLNKGQMYYEKKESLSADLNQGLTIDFRTGTILNATIDGGSWDSQ